MEEIRTLINEYNVEIILGLVVAYLLLFIGVIISQYKTKKSRERYQALVNGMDGINIEEVLLRVQKDISNIDTEINGIDLKIKGIEEKLAFAIRKVGFMRYNAFDDMGSKLSFSLALLDDFKNGFVISSIYSREDTITYGKEVKNGTSKIPLSTEEILVIDRAIKGESI